MALLAALAAIVLPFVLAFFGVGLVNGLVIEPVALSAYRIPDEFRDGRGTHSTTAREPFHRRRVVHFRHTPTT